MRFPRLLALPAALLLALCACTPDASSSGAPTVPPDPAPAPTGAWYPPPYGANCGVETLYIATGDDAASHDAVDAVLTAADVPVFVAASLVSPASKVSFDASSAGERENEFVWKALSAIVTHFAPAEQTRLDGKVFASSEIVEGYFNAYFKHEQFFPSLPPIPDALSGTVRLSDGEYAFEPTDGIYPHTDLTLAYTDIDGALMVYADVIRDADDAALTAEIVLRPRADGTYALCFAGVAPSGDDVFAPFTVTGYGIEIQVPDECVLTESGVTFASFKAANGLGISVAEQGFTGDFEDMRAADRRIPHGETLAAEFASDPLLDYGVITDTGENLRYLLVRLMESGNAVRIEVTVPREWASDYFLLAESLFIPFGARFPDETLLALEDYVFALGLPE
ncbi:MAG: hypothetical protein LBR85_09555 [Oscillospiraceae bacterium]|jgi:hypothetical protein|nr:hypothetical protein [Oscillospiraceae bacterium]